MLFIRAKKKEKRVWHSDKGGEWTKIQLRMKKRQTLVQRSRKIKATAEQSWRCREEREQHSFTNSDVLCQEHTLQQADSSPVTEQPACIWASTHGDSHTCQHICNQTDLRGFLLLFIGQCRQLCHVVKARWIPVFHKLSFALAPLSCTGRCEGMIDYVYDFCFFQTK